MSTIEKLQKQVAIMRRSLEAIEGTISTLLIEEHSGSEEETVAEKQLHVMKKKNQLRAKLAYNKKQAASAEEPVKLKSYQDKVAKYEAELAQLMVVAPAAQAS